ncbi:MAG TPA: malto-oligosyltrehalose synthase [Terriglobales bacterium]|nr:malto-oligosyltrehalose synthase [Terriglobales bacterium]
MRTSDQPVESQSLSLTEALEQIVNQPGTRPLSTYRIQFHSGFGLTQARELVSYLHDLGVSHLYASPLLEARAGSMHGYDIINHERLNPEIGTEEDLRELVRELNARDMSIVLDIVPNHMGVSTSTRWWRDVLQHGRASEYGDFFDIDWNPLKPELHNKLLLPVLGGQYGEELEQGRLQVRNKEGELVVQYYDHDFPLDPQTLPLIFEALGPLPEARDEASANDLHCFGEMLEQLRSLPQHSSADPDQGKQRSRKWEQIRLQWQELLQHSTVVRQLLDRALEHVNGKPGDAGSFDLLHLLLELQVYRLAHWRVSGEEINYRRFFDINDLVGLRMENPRVFAATHRTLRRMLAEKMISGVRIDHCDGMLNPRQYLIRLQMLFADARLNGQTPASPEAENGISLEVQQIFSQHDWMYSKHALYAVVEKILEPGEELPEEWPVDGTSGYDFTNQVNGLFIDKANERAFDRSYLRFVGQVADVDTLIYQSKKLIMHNALASEVNVLTHLLGEICSSDRRARDFTLKTLRDSIRETIACFPVYRTYIDERGEYTARDKEYIEFAIRKAKRLNPGMSDRVFDFLRDTLELKGGRLDETTYRRKLYFALKFQQLTGPVMAKGLEDTVCYVYNRFVSVNEVGGSPKHFGVTPAEFHAGNVRRAERWPASMLATSTHDTKRSEDVRARLNVLSEMPKLWSAFVMRARRLNRNHKVTISDGRVVPDANEEYLLYQTLVGVWPWDGNAANRGELLQRVQDYMTKAVHEAKVNLSWVNPNAEYVDALRTFIATILGGRVRANSFVSLLQDFVQPVSYFGMINSLAQTTLKLTSPGIPDIYQGTELWDFSLVDPDNRRPVDFESRRQMLGNLRSSSDPATAVRDLLQSYQDGCIKMWITMRGLEFRREYPGLFQNGTYVPLESSQLNEHVCAFARVHEHSSRTETAIVAVPRLSYTLMGGKPIPPIEHVWGDASLKLPEGVPEEFENIFTGKRVKAKDHAVLCREMFEELPVCVLSG